MLANFKVNKYDRDYQIWKREPLSIELITESTPPLAQADRDYVDDGKSGKEKW